MTDSTAMDNLIQRSIDGELNAQEQEQLAQHLACNPADAARHNDLKRQADLISKSVPTPTAAHLSSLRPQAPRGMPAGMRLAASVLIFAAGLGAGALLGPGGGPGGADLQTFAHQAGAAHSLYVSEVLHPVEVAASEKEHLQNWLSNRLGAAIIAPQLGDTGFTLIGGRLLPAGDRASALFMYENANGERLSLVATHGHTSQNQSFRFQQDDEHLIVFWQDGPWRYSLIGDQKREPMGQIAQMVHGQMI